jgi:hypothetical protein
LGPQNLTLKIKLKSGADALWVPTNLSNWYLCKSPGSDQEDNVCSNAQAAALCYVNTCEPQASHRWLQSPTFVNYFHVRFRVQDEFPWPCLPKRQGYCVSIHYRELVGTRDLQTLWHMTSLSLLLTILRTLYITKQHNSKCLFLKKGVICKSKFK